MPNLNKVLLMGNLTRDPELRYTTTGSAICNFGLAINRHFQDKSGEKKEEVCFVDCSAFGKTAETIANYSKKGNPLLVEGRLQFRQWDGEDGRKQSKLSVVIDSFQFIGSGDKIKTDKPLNETRLPLGGEDIVSEEIPF